MIGVGRCLNHRAEFGGGLRPQFEFFSDDRPPTQVPAEVALMRHQERAGRPMVRFTPLEQPMDLVD
jgi:hypothetical protein